MRFEEKCVVVTGASSGMGRRIALDFAKEGATVVAVARRKERLDEIAAEAEAFAGKILPYQGRCIQRRSLQRHDRLRSRSMRQAGYPCKQRRHHGRVRSHWRSEK